MIRKIFTFLLIINSCIFVQSCDSDENERRLQNGCSIRITGDTEIVQGIGFSIPKDDACFYDSEGEHTSPYRIGIYGAGGSDIVYGVETDKFAKDIDFDFSLNNMDTEERSVTIEALWLSDGDVVKKKTRTKTLQPSHGVAERW